jgi:antitoxin HicB
VKAKVDVYPFTVRKMSPDEGEGYLVEYPDVLGCIADGLTPEEAIVNGREALQGCLDLLKEMGRPIPKPSSFAQSSGQWRQRVPKSLHARLTAKAEQEGVSLNTLVTSMIAEGLGRDEPSPRKRTSSGKDEPRGRKKRFDLGKRIRRRTSRLTRT